MTVIRQAYSFTPSIDLMLELQDLTPEQKLDWLEQAKQFVAAFVPAGDIERWRRVLAADEEETS